jgi:hypothetical protein
MKEFKVIQIKTSEFDGRMYYDSYKYVSGIITDYRGNIKITTCEDVLDAMRFNDWHVLDDHEKKVRDKFLDLIKSYFPKKDYTITYHTVKIVY